MSIVDELMRWDIADVISQTGGINSHPVIDIDAGILGAGFYNGGNANLRYPFADLYLADGTADGGGTPLTMTTGTLYDNAYVMGVGSTIGANAFLRMGEAWTGGAAGGDPYGNLNGKTTRTVWGRRHVVRAIVQPVINAAGFQPDATGPIIGVGIGYSGIGQASLPSTSNGQPSALLYCHTNDRNFYLYTARGLGTNVTTQLPGVQAPSAAFGAMHMAIDYNPWEGYIDAYVDGVKYLRVNPTFPTIGNSGLFGANTFCLTGTNGNAVVDVHVYGLIRMTEMYRDPASSET